MKDSVFLNFPLLSPMILKIFMDCDFKVNLNGLSNDGLHFEDSLW